MLLNVENCLESNHIENLVEKILHISPEMTATHNTDCGHL